MSAHYNRHISQLGQTISFQVESSRDIGTWLLGSKTARGVTAAEKKPLSLADLAIFGPLSRVDIVISLLVNDLKRR